MVSIGKDASGKYKQYTETIRGTRRQAEKRLTEILHELDKGLLSNPAKITLADFLTRWLNDYVAVNLAPRTLEGYRTIINYRVIPALGNIMLNKLTAGHIQKYYADLLDAGLSPQTVRHHHACLHKALQTAIEWGLANRNVCDVVKPPRAHSKEMRCWNAEQVNQFLDFAKGSVYYPLFSLALHTGMRRSELLALRWLDVDLLLCQVSVSRTMHQLLDNSFVFRSTKTAKGRRTIALSPAMAIMLREHREAQDAMRSGLGLPSSKDSDLMFSHYDGTPLRPGSVSHAWSKMVRKSGLPVIRLHDARHTHASILLKQGVHPKMVQERLGHSSISITLDTYSHVTPGMHHEAALAFDKALGRKFLPNSYHSENQLDIRP